MSQVEEYIEKHLFALADEKYREFQHPLIPTVAPDRIIGVRTPQLRKFAKAFGKTDYAEHFITMLPHKYYEEDNLHAFLIEQIKDFDKCLSALDIFLPYVDNWATCDMMSPKILSTNLQVFKEHINKWLSSEQTYEIRFGIVSLMEYFLDDAYDTSILYKVSSVKSNEYYVNMARAWFFATALINHYDDVTYILKENVLDVFTHNKTIQKAVDSFRVTKEHKTELKQLKRKI